MRVYCGDCPLFRPDAAGLTPTCSCGTPGAGAVAAAAALAAALAASACCTACAIIVDICAEVIVVTGSMPPVPAPPTHFPPACTLANTQCWQPLNSGHTRMQQWPQSRHPRPRPVLACSLSTQQWPHDNPTVATVEASVATAGASIRPVGLNSGHTRMQQWPQSRHPRPRPVLACSLSTQQWPHDNPTVATVEASVATAGAGIRAVDSTVATTHCNSGHSHGLRGHGWVRIEPVDSTVATTDCYSGHSSLSTRAAGSARIQSLYTPVATGDCNATPAKQPWPLARTQSRTHA